MQDISLPMKKLKIVGVMGSGKKAWAHFSEPLGTALASRSVHLLTGGGDGVMKTVSRAFVSVADREGMCMGCIPMQNDRHPGLEAPSNYPNQYVEIPIYTPLGVYNPEQPERVTRNHINILTSDIVIALPGMGGTRNEIDLCGQFGKAVLLYGPEEEFADLDANIPRASELDTAMQWLDRQLTPQPF
jgi:uncharacterized protein (TIGR00725 family)